MKILCWAAAYTVLPIQGGNTAWSGLDNFVIGNGTPTTPLPLRTSAAQATLLQQQNKAAGGTVGTGTGKRKPLYIWELAATDVPHNDLIINTARSRTPATHFFKSTIQITK